MPELPFQPGTDAAVLAAYVDDTDPTGWVTATGTATLSVAALRTYLDIKVGDKGPLLSATLLSAVRIAEGFTRRALLRTVDTKQFTLRTRYAPQYVRIPDLVEPVTVALDGVELTRYTEYLITGWPREDDPAPHLLLNVFPKELTVRDQPDTPNTLTITGTWGYDPANMPADLADAILVLAARRYREKDAGYADTLDFSHEGGSLNYFRQLPANVKLTFEAYTPKSDWLGA